MLTRWQHNLKFGWSSLVHHNSHLPYLIFAMSFCNWKILNCLFFPFVMTGSGCFLAITTSNYGLLYISSVDYSNATVDYVQHESQFHRLWQDYKQTTSRLQVDYYSLQQTIAVLHSRYTFSTGSTGTTGNYRHYCSLLQSAAICGSRPKVCWWRALVPLALPPFLPILMLGEGSLSMYPPSSSSQVMAPPTVPSR